MYEPSPADAPCDTVAWDIATYAHDARLTVYAGAGISMGEPTSLPGAAELARRVAASLDGPVSFAGVDRSDLLAVADKVAACPRGAAILRDAILKVADLLAAHPNYGHQVIALLLCEGAATVFETNYDTCIERASQPETPHVVRTADDMLNGPATALLKAHGCAQRRDTMLITTEELAARPMWAEAAVRARLNQDRLLFVGIGSVADYIRQSIAAILDEIGVAHLLVVDPRLSEWETNPDLDWRTLFESHAETLIPEQRDARGASEFLDAVLRAYVQIGLGTTRGMVAGFIESNPQRAGTEAVLHELGSKTAVRTTRWLRGATWPLCPGRRVLDDAAPTTQGLLALGSLITTEWTVDIGVAGWLLATPSEPPEPAPGVQNTEPTAILTLLVTRASDGPDAVREARTRIREAKGNDEIPASADVVVVVTGNVTGSLGLEEVPLGRRSTLGDLLRAAHADLAPMPADLVGTTDADHLVDGASSGRSYFVNGAHIAEAQRA